LTDSGLVLQIFGQCGRGNAVNANTSALAASMSVPIFGKRPASWSRTSSQVAATVAGWVHVEQRPVTPADFAGVVEALEEVFRAAMATGNPVRWH
jgi:hypothetical protein